MTDKERYFWDLTGFVVINQVLSKDEVKEVNEAIDEYSRQALEQDYAAARGKDGKTHVFGGKLVRTTNAYPFSCRFPSRYRHLSARCSSTQRSSRF